LLRYSHLIKNKDLYVLIIGRIIQVSIALAAIKILTTILSKEEVGNYYLLITILTLLNFSFFNPIGMYYGRHIIGWNKTNNLLNATNILFITRFFGIFISLFFVYIIYVYMDYSSYYGVVELLFFITIALIASTHGDLVNVLNTLEDRVKFMKYLVITLLIGIIFSIFIALFVDKSGMGWLYGLFISQIIFSILIYKYIAKNRTYSYSKIILSFNSTNIKKIAYFIVPITITLFLEWGQNMSYRFILENRYSLEILASIAVGLSVSGAIFSAVEGLVSQYFNPIYLRQITNTTKEIRTKSWNTLADNMISIYILLMIFIISLSPYLVNILVAEKFHDVYIYTMIGALIEFFRVMTNVVFKVAMSELKTKRLIFPYLVGSIISIGTIYFIDFSEDLWKIPLVLGASYGVIFMMMFYNMRKLLPISIELGSINKALFLSLPFGIFFFFNTYSSMLWSFAIVLIAGLYFLLTIYLLKIKIEEVK